MISLETIIKWILSVGLPEWFFGIIGTVIVGRFASDIVWDRCLNKSMRKNDKSIVFQDNFKNGNKNKWYLNMWGSKNPDKTNRIEDGVMVFEANENEWDRPDKENGAYLDLDRGVYEGNEYEIACMVAAIANTTMMFDLWIHDTRESNTVTTYFFIPKKKYKTVRLNFIPTKTNAIRIHLHAKAGAGKIMVKEVTVKKSLNK